LESELVNQNSSVSKLRKSGSNSLETTQFELKVN